MLFNNESIERLLRGIEPKEPSESLGKRIAADLRSSNGIREALLSFESKWIAGLSVVAACLVLIVAISMNEYFQEASDPVGKSGKESFQTVLEDFVPTNRFDSLIERNPSEVFFLDDGKLAQGIHFKYLETLVLENRSNDASLTITLPREEIRIIPVVAY